MLGSCDEKTPWTLLLYKLRRSLSRVGGEERRDVGVRIGGIVQDFYVRARILSQEVLVRLFIDFLINHLRWWLFVFPYSMINV